MAEWKRETSWRQGNLLTHDAAISLGLIQPDSDDAVVIVASHDCDLAQEPASEPLVELVVGNFIEKLDGNYSNAKTSRKLHLELSGTDTFCAEFDATRRIGVDKLALADFSPRADLNLTPENTNIFQLWLASRYRRSAFPDEFERRLRDEKLAEKIAKAVKPHGALLTGIFFDVDEGIEVVRNGSDDVYVLDIFILHSSEPDFDAAETAAQLAKAAIENAFNTRLFDPAKGWKQIELRSCEVVSETVLTYHQFKQLKRWRLEHLSLARHPQQPIVVE